MTGTEEEKDKRTLDALHTAHVLPVRPTYTPDRPSGIVHECGRSA